MNLRYTKLYRVYLAYSIYLSLKIWTTNFPWRSLFVTKLKKRKDKKTPRFGFTSSIKRRIRKCHVVDVQWMSKKCTKKRDARAELLFCSYHKLYFDVIVAVVLRSCFNFLLSSCALNSCWPSFYICLISLKRGHRVFAWLRAQPGSRPALYAKT